MGETERLAVRPVRSAVGFFSIAKLLFSPSSSSSRAKKSESTNVAENSSRHKVDDNARPSVKESQSHSKSSSNNHQTTSVPSNGNNDVHSERQTRLPSPADDGSSRMSFSSSSSHESSSLHQQTNGTTNDNASAVPPDPANRPVDKEKSESPMEIDGPTSTITKAERDQELQRYYRADLIQHLTDWSSTQFEKQVRRFSSPRSRSPPSCF